MSQYTEGIVHDGAAIIKDGKMQTIEQILEQLNRIEGLEKARSLEDELLLLDVTVLKRQLAENECTPENCRHGY